MKTTAKTKVEPLKTPSEFFEGKVRKAKREGKKGLSLLELQASYKGYERYVKRHQNQAN